MSSLDNYYADKIRALLGKGKENGLTRFEIMKRMNVSDPSLFEAIMKEAKRKCKVLWENGKYYIPDDIPSKLKKYIATRSRDGVERTISIRDEYRR